MRKATDCVRLVPPAIGGGCGPLPRGSFDILGGAQRGSAYFNFSALPFFQSYRTGALQHPDPTRGILPAGHRVLCRNGVDAQVMLCAHGSLHWQYPRKVEVIQVPGVFLLQDPALPHLRGRDSSHGLRQQQISGCGTATICGDYLPPGRFCASVL